MYVCFYLSKSNILLELVKLIGEERQVAVEFLWVCHDGVDLVGEAHVFRLLGDKVVLSKSTGLYIFYSKIFTSIISFVLDYSVVCLPSFSTPWNSEVRVFRVEIYWVSVAFNFLVWTWVVIDLPLLFRASRRRWTLFRSRAASWGMSLWNLLLYMHQLTCTLRVDLLKGRKRRKKWNGIGKRDRRKDFFEGKSVFFKKWWNLGRTNLFLRWIVVKGNIVGFKSAKLTVTLHLTPL
jgi:hypothetical protein